MPTSKLGPAERGDALRRMAATGMSPQAGELDVLVVGGGVVGAGAALDAATRGLRVGLLEARDWASGTSSRSSKLIHGGLRYLEMLDFRLVREALKERGLLLRTLAPHLVRPVPFLYPLRHRGWERLYAGAGILLYDLLGFSAGYSRGLPRHRHLSRQAALHAVPGLRADALVGAISYWDAQVDDARHTLALVRTAARHGALCANRARVVGFLRDGERVVGVRVRDLEAGTEFDVRARAVVNATGVWTDETQAMVGEHGQFRVRASKGVHLLVPRERIAATSGLILRTETSVLFVIPWRRHWIVGTTDTDWDLDKAHPAASSRDIDYLLDRLNEVLAARLTREDVVGVYAGLRPLLAGESDVTSALSREHIVAEPAPGLVVVAGGKYTTYRVMAADAVDVAVRAWPKPAAAAVSGGAVVRVAASVTHQVPLLGADGYAALLNSTGRLAVECGLSVAVVERLLARHGSAVDEVLRLIEDDPGLREPLGGAGDYLRAEAVYAAAYEGARHVDDVLTRRTRISIETPHRGTETVREVATLMAPVLGWEVAQCEREVEHYLRRVAAERASQAQPDDRSADATRLGAPEIVPVD